MNTADLPIRDIKPLLKIPDFSIYFFVALLVVSALLALVLFWWVRRWMGSRGSVDPRIGWLEKLERIDFSDPKRAAYTMTKYGRLLAEDKRRQEIMAQLVPRLEKYKYKKEVPPLDEETIRFMKLFIEMSRDAL